jgi:hypothetical protein
MFECRRLGGNSAADQVKARTNSLIIGTGNKLTFAGDMSKDRGLQTNLRTDKTLAERTFSHWPLDKYVTDMRAALVSAGLTILRAYQIAPDKVAGPNFRFPEWRAIVADALVWLGEADPVLATERVKADDPKEEAQRDVGKEATRIETHLHNSLLVGPGVARSSSIPPPRQGSATLTRWFKSLRLHCLEHRSLGHQAGCDIAPERHHQLARQGHDGEALASVERAMVEPSAERAFRLVPQPQPGQFNRGTASARVARFAGPLDSINPPALPWTGRWVSVVANTGPRLLNRSKRSLRFAISAAAGVRSAGTGGCASASSWSRTSISRACSCLISARIRGGTGRPCQSRCAASYVSQSRRRGFPTAMPWSRSSAVIRLVWAVCSLVSRWRSRVSRRASSCSGVGTRTIRTTRGSPRK